MAVCRFGKMAICGLFTSIRGASRVRRDAVLKRKEGIIKETESFL